MTNKCRKTKRKGKKEIEVLKTNKLTNQQRRIEREKEEANWSFRMHSPTNLQTDIKTKRRKRKKKERKKLVKYKSPCMLN